MILRISTAKKKRKCPIHLYEDGGGGLYLLREGDDVAIGNIEYSENTFFEDAMEFEDWCMNDPDSLVDASWWDRENGPNHIATLNRETGHTTVHRDSGFSALWYIKDGYILEEMND